ncbi:MAG: VWA domain-containing protein [Deltaproteobacteria bacterium]|nr:VWA domain-containing protein [Deltaproteobacteria bacterium]
MRWLLAAVLLALTRPAAAADDTELEPQRVTARLRDTHVAFAIRVRVPLDRAYFPTASVQVEVPLGGVVTGGTAFADGAAHALPLVETARASDGFYAVGSASTTASRAIAVLVTPLTSEVQIEVASPRGGAIDIALEVDAPTCFSHDRRWVQLPDSWHVAGSVDAAPAGCSAVGEGRWLGLRAAAPDFPIGVIAGRLALAGGDFAKVEVDLGRELATVPDDLDTVILVDASRSLTDGQREAQRVLLASYLPQVPHSMVQVIAVARRPRPLLPSWMESGAAAARVDRELRRIVAANGSNVDLAIGEAGAWLSRVPGTHRVIVLTDELVKSELEGADAASWAGLVPAGTVVHVVALRSIDAPLARDDDVMFGALAKATGGIGATGGTLGDAAMLVRPISVDNIAIEGTGWEAEGFEGCPDRLDAGTSCTWFARATAAAAGPVRVSGLLWNTKVTRVVVPQKSGGLAIARELAATGTFDTPLQLEIDRAALAVDSAWSLFGTWGGRGGYADQMGFGTSGTMSGRSVGAIVDRFGTARAIGALDLKDQLIDALGVCGPFLHGTIEISLTREEIVDVQVRNAGDDTHCIEEAIWSTAVRVPDPQDHARTLFTI